MLDMISTSCWASRIDGRPPPYNLEAEQALLGAILVNNDALYRVSNFLLPDHFYDPLHGQIYATLATLIHAGKTATPTTLKTFFENVEPIGAEMTIPRYLWRLEANATTFINAAEYGRTIFDLSTRRKLILVGEDIVDAAYNVVVDAPPNDQIDEAHCHLDRLAEQSNFARPKLRTLDDLQPLALRPYVWKNVVAPGEVGTLFAVSQAGKGFFLLELAWNLTQGANMMGRRTRAVPVLQVQYEGTENIAKRVHALINKSSDAELETFRRRYAWVDEYIYLGRGTGGDRGESALIAEARRLSKRAGEPVGLITIDTIAKAIAGESTNDDDAIASLYARGRRIANETGAAVMFVAHPGHSDKSRPAGSYQIIGSNDFLMMISAAGYEAAITIPVDAVRTVTLPKSKDGRSGITLGAYRLNKIDLATDDDGDPITSCRIECIESMTETSGQPARPKPGTEEAKAFNELQELINNGKFTLTTNLTIPRAPVGTKLVRLDDWRAACLARRLGEGTDESEKTAFRRAKKGLEGGGNTPRVRPPLIDSFGDHVWIVAGTKAAHVEAQNSQWARDKWLKPDNRTSPDNGRTFDDVRADGQGRPLRGPSTCPHCKPDNEESQTSAARYIAPEVEWPPKLSVSTDTTSAP